MLHLAALANEGLANEGLALAFGKLRGAERGEPQPAHVGYETGCGPALISYSHCHREYITTELVSQAQRVCACETTRECGHCTVKRVFGGIMNSRIKRMRTSALPGVEKSKILRDREQELVKRLKDKDLIELSTKLFQNNLISKETKLRFVTLDHNNLQSQLQVRYLLQHVYARVSQRLETFDSFFETLDEFDNGIACLCSSVQIVDGKEVDTAGDIYFSERHVSDLTEFLVHYSDKWEELGVMLRLSRSQIGECRNYHSNKLKLCHVINEWVTGDQVPTSSKLKNALASEVVGLFNVACKVEEKFGVEHTKRSSQSTTSDFKILQQSNDTTIQHCKSALLGVKILSAKLAEYQWKLNGENLHESKVFSGVNEAVLFIDYVGGPKQGHYKCTIRDGDRIIDSEEMVLTIKYVPITDHFFRRYQTILPELPGDAWPPVTSAEFINLALVMKKEGITKRYAYSIQGDMDDIIECKEKISYDSVFGTCDDGSLILVEGRPGSGKTTLMHKITRDWALQKNILWDSKIVLLVPLRLLGINNCSISLSDIFELYTDNESQRGMFVLTVKKEGGKGLCIIIDGLDEYEHRNDKTTIIYKLIHKLILPLAVIIVASRPIGTASVRQTASFTKRLEVLGFTNDQIFKYLQSYYKDDNRMAIKLQSYLQLHLNVLRMCYLPVHAAMICYMYSFLGDNIPQTETEIYMYFTQLTLQRKVKRDDENCCIRIESLNDLPKNMDGYFNKVCSLAFNMSVNAKQVVLQTETEFPLSHSSLASDSPSLGLVIIDSTAAMFGFKDTYTFLHLTFQEYLAAVYLTRLEDDEQLALFTKYGSRSDFRMILRFFCGMTKFEGKFPLVKYIMTNTNMDMVSKCQCAYESQQAIVCESVFNYTEVDSVIFYDHTFVPADFFAISYVLSASQFFINKLTFDKCILDDDGIKVFIEKLNTKKLRAITYLGYFIKNDLLSWHRHGGINLLLRELSSLEVLNLDTHIPMYAVRSILYGVRLPSLNIMKLGCSMVVNETKINFKFLKIGSSELKIYLAFSESENYIEAHIQSAGLIRAFGLKIFLDPNNTLLFFCNNPLKLARYIDLKMYLVFPESDNYIQQCVESARFISAFGLKIFLDPNNPLLFFCNNPLKLARHIDFNFFSRISKVVLINCCISDGEVELIVEPLKSWSALQTVHLDFNNISCKGAKVLSGTLNKAIHLEVFSINCNQIGDTGGLELAKALNSMSHLRLFDCRYNPISEEGSLGLSLVLKKFNMFAKLLFTTDSYSGTIKLTTESVFQELQSIIDYGNYASRIDAFKCCGFMSHIHITDKPLIFRRNMWVERKTNYCKTYCKQCCHGDGVLSFQPELRTFKDVVGLANALKYCMHLNVLTLNFSRIGSYGVVALADGLKTSRNLQILDLQDSDIGISGIVALAVTFKYCVNLKVLDLSSDEVDSDGTKVLVTGLKHCKNLSVLNLQRNIVGRYGAMALADLLMYSTSIQMVNLRYNVIDVSGAIALAKASKMCLHLQSLLLYANSIDADSFDLVAAHNPEVVKN